MRARLLVVCLLLTGSLFAGRSLILVTNRGDIEAELLPDVAPLFVAAFEEFVSAEAFDSLRVTLQPGQYLLVEPGVGAPGFPALPLEVNTAALGLDTLLVRDSWHAGLLPAHHALQDSSVATLLRRQGYRFLPSQASLSTRRGMLAAHCTGTGTPTGGFFIVLSDAASRWLNGRYTVFGRVVSGEELLGEPQAAVEPLRVHHLILR
ncbi:MAG: peptidylprolyl isomerase [Candidatus Cloacimonetes bacterium]|nr:peptidylprolyl isomerase [Candidatus Cloacimonadota bacterium]